MAHRSVMPHEADNVLSHLVTQNIKYSYTEYHAVFFGGGGETIQAELQSPQLSQAEGHS